MWVLGFLQEQPVLLLAEPYVQDDTCRFELAVRKTSATAGSLGLTAQQGPMLILCCLRPTMVSGATHEQLPAGCTSSSSPGSLSLSVTVPWLGQSITREYKEKQNHIEGKTPTQERSLPIGR